MMTPLTASPAVLSVEAKQQIQMRSLGTQMYRKEEEKKSGFLQVVLLEICIIHLLMVVPSLAFPHTPATTAALSAVPMAPITNSGARYAAVGAAPPWESKSVAFPPGHSPTPDAFPVMVKKIDSENPHLIPLILRGESPL